MEQKKATSKRNTFLVIGIGIVLISLLVATILPLYLYVHRDRDLHGSGLLIAMEESLEVFQPSTGRGCVVAWYVPDYRHHHTHCLDLLCGGQETSRTCLRVGDLSISHTEILMVQERRGHLCWGLPGDSGDVMLLGGEAGEAGGGAGTSTETVRGSEGPSSPGFQLEYRTM